MAESIHIPKNTEQVQFPSFDAVIPAYVRYDPKLSNNAKLLYGELRALTNAYGFCWASNEYFAALYQVDVRTIKRWLENLENAGHIVQTKERDDETHKLVRIIRLSFPAQEEPSKKMDKNVQKNGQKCPKKMDKIVHSNNTSNNNKDIYSARARVTQKKPNSKNNFNNFQQREYPPDFYNQLELAIWNNPHGKFARAGDSS